MATAPITSAFRHGFIAGLPFILVAMPFGLLFGVVGTEAGLSIAEVMGFSVAVIAGAAQFAALQLMQDNAPTLIIVATALAVNLRMAMYSASLAPHLGPAPLWKRALAAYVLVDQVYAVSIARFENAPAMSIGEKLAYYFGSALPLVPTWYGASFAGAWAGAAIPPEYGLDFAIPITFLALVGPMLRSLAHVAAALTSVVMALALAGLPYNSGLLIAAVAAMVMGAEVERRMNGGKQP